MKRYLLLFFILAYISSTAQVIDAGPDTVACPGNVTLNATVNNPTSSNGYSIIQIPYSPYTYTGGTPVTLTDDAVAGPFSIGFSFYFMGSSPLTQFYIGSNGWVAFSPQPTSYPYVPIPDNTGSTPRDCIMGAFQDLNPGAGGSINYYTTGTAPNRKLVISWSSVPLYQCNTPVTQQIVLYETTNVIENYFQGKPVCTTWANGNSIQGLHDAAGNIAVPVPGRNFTQWTATNEGWRYVPGAAAAFGPVNWYNAAGSPAGTGNSINVNVSSATYYVATVYDTTTATTYDDTVYISIGIPGLNVTVNNPSCGNTTDGSASASAPGGPYTYSWSTGATTSFISGIGAGSYWVTVTNSSSGCTETVNFTISAAALFNAFATHYDESCPGCSDGIAYSYPSGGTPPYTFLWQPGGATTQDYYNVSPGTYTVCITDANNCTVCDSTTVYAFGTGIMESEGILFNVSPNPSVGELSLYFPAPIAGEAAVSIIDLTGRIVFSEALAPNTGSHMILLPSSAGSGLYFLRVSTPAGASTRKIQVIRGR
jgi:hypothetical protein